MLKVNYISKKRRQKPIGCCMGDGMKDPRTQARTQGVWCAGLSGACVRGDGSPHWKVGWCDSGEDVGDSQGPGGVRDDGRLPAWVTVWINSITCRSKT